MLDACGIVVCCASIGVLFPCIDLMFFGWACCSSVAALARTRCFCLLFKPGGAADTDAVSFLLPCVAVVLLALILLVLWMRLLRCVLVRVTVLRVEATHCGCSGAYIAWRCFCVGAVVSGVLRAHVFAAGLLTPCCRCAWCVLC